MTVFHVVGYWIAGGANDLQFNACSQGQYREYIPPPIPFTLTAANARRLPAGFSAKHMYVPSSFFIALSIISRLRPLMLGDATNTNKLVLMKQNQAQDRFVSNTEIQS